ncbi:MAG TPA: TIGR04076 family protein [candidate division Zixibacteria bacterium]|nr:TIGR04076 family protein [candidate division Zixibacteria bacterium]
MSKRHDVKVTLVSQLGKCPAGHKVGDEFIVGRHTPAGICLGAFGSLLPFITTLRYGGSFPWEKTEGEGTFCCPDPKVVNTFKLERLP